MLKNKKNQSSAQSLPIEELRRQWSVVWGRMPHARIGRAMLEKSLAYRLREQNGAGLSDEQHKRLAQFIKQYKRNQNCFDEKVPILKPGTRLVRNWNGTRHSVIVQPTGYEYKGKLYGSLSQIASEIAGTRWNGWVFFGLKKTGGTA